MHVWSIKCNTEYVMWYFSHMNENQNPRLISDSEILFTLCYDIQGHTFSQGRVQVNAVVNQCRKSYRNKGTQKY